jgi:hypothetical protein
MEARFNFFGNAQVYLGTVANLLGRSAVMDGLAIAPSTLGGDAYRVLVSVPSLGMVPNCAIGQRGQVIFNTAGG